MTVTVSVSRDISEPPGVLADLETLNLRRSLHMTTVVLSDRRTKWLRLIDSHGDSEPRNIHWKALRA